MQAGTQAAPSFRCVGGSRLVTLVLAMILLAAGTTAVSAAQSAPDESRTTEHVELWFASDLPELPDLVPELFLARFGEELDAAVSELALILATDPPMVSIQVAQDLGDGAAFVVDPERLTISMDGPALVAMTDVDAVNTIRRAIATALVQHTTAGNQAPLFVTGMALYAQRPLTPVISRHAANLQNANSQGALLSWADLNRSGGSEAGAGDVAMASQYAVTAWLIDHFQLPRYQQFMREMQSTTDWRIGIERAYGLPADELERQWRADLPRWTNNDWKTNIIAGFDLDPARTLLERGNFAAAKVSLERSQRLFSELGDEQHLQVVTALLAQTEIGLQAEALMSQTEAALRQHDYERASDLIAQAEAQYALMPPEHRPEAVLADYRARSDAGLLAIEQLERATRQAGSWTEFPQARNDAIAAGRTFAALGDATRLDAAEITLKKIDERVRRLVYLLGGLAFLSFVWLLLWRRHGTRMGMSWAEPVRTWSESRNGTRA